MDFMDIGLTGQGLFPKPLKAYVQFVDGGVVAGELQMFDFGDADTAGLITNPGGPEGGSVFNTVRDVDAVGTNQATLTGYWYCWATDTQAAASSGWAVVRGITDVTTASCAAGDTLVVAAGQALALSVPGVPTDSKIVAIALAAGTSVKAIVDGVNGFGHDG